MNRIVMLTGLVLSAALPSLGQAPAVLTWDSVVERARQSAPAILAARMRIDETRARTIGAALPFSSNPSLDIEGGPRRGSGASTDYEVALAQDLDLPARKRARLDAARAGVTQEEQRAREVERDVLREVAGVYLRALEARERAGAATGAKRLAEEALQIADRRFRAGDVAQLDVNLARTAVARAEAEARTAEAMLIGQTAQLAALLGMPREQAVSIGGSLRDPLTGAGDDPVAGAAARAAERADLRSDVRLLDAEIAEVAAEQQLADGMRWPGFGLRASYRREGGDRIVFGGIGLSLPVFNRGQESTALATAKLARLRAEREALIRTIETEVRGALATYDALRTAAQRYEQTVLPLIEENERLALESYDVGQVGLAELLAVRRDSLDARRTLVDQLVETRRAEIELRARTGVWK
jgi:cobalt-zinc-cadmium efflux system outer membrane protein